MPEGDTLARIALTLRDALVGHRVVRFTSPIPALRDAELEGHTIASVETRGKNLLIGFDDGRTLHTHLRMSGEWHLYGLESRWRRPRQTALVTIETEGFGAKRRSLSNGELEGRGPSNDEGRVAVMFRTEGLGAPPIVRLLSKDALRRDRMLRSLGPDVLSPSFDVDEATRRVHASIRATIAEALLDQRDVAGIGNEYKSELLFLCRIDPRRAPQSVPESEIRALLERARELMTANVARGRSGRFAITGRVTRFRPGPTRWVYGRARRPCLECGTPIRDLRQGLDRRSTYYCPRCQK